MLVPVWLFSQPRDTVWEYSDRRTHSIEKTVGIPVLDPVLCEGLLTLFELLRRENMED